MNSLTKSCCGIRYSSIQLLQGFSNLVLNSFHQVFAKRKAVPVMANKSKVRSKSVELGENHSKFEAWVMVIVIYKFVSLET